MGDFDKFTILDGKQYTLHKIVQNDQLTPDSNLERFELSLDINGTFPDKETAEGDLVRASLLAGFIISKEFKAGGQSIDILTGYAYLPDEIMRRADIVDEAKMVAFRAILEATKLGNDITPVAFAFQYSDNTNTVETLFEVRGLYRLPGFIVALFSSGHELLQRVALTQYGLSSEDRKYLRSIDLSDYVLRNINNDGFLRMWSILITASINSTNLLSRDPTTWVDPKIVRLQQQTSERTAAEINQYILDHRT